MTRISTLSEKKPEEFVFDYLSRDTISKILGTVVYDRAFFFYEDIGKPTGDFSTSLTDFCEKVNKISAKSLAFHLKRGDFENWIREVIGDIELSNRLVKLKENKRARSKVASLRTKMQQTVKDRITELQDMWHQALTWPESVVA